MTVHQATDRLPTVCPHRRLTNEFWVVCVHNEFCLVRRRIATRVLWSKNNLVQRSELRTKRNFVSVDGNCFYISIFHIFYQLCPLVWNIEIERGKENEKVGGNQAKLNESESGRELEKGDAIQLTSSGRGSRKETEKGGRMLLTSSRRGIEKGGAI